MPAPLQALYASFSSDNEFVFPESTQLSSSIKTKRLSAGAVVEATKWLKASVKLVTTS
jgi:hypothetical protein